jgi:RNA polymerase sigma factor (sigma-70 family)
MLNEMRKNGASMSDQELLKAYRQSGDRDWLGILLERYTMLLLGVCMKYLKGEEEARDMVQQVHLKALTEWEKYPVEYPKSWLYTVARNECLMRLRAGHRHTTEIDTIVPQTITDEPAIEEVLKKEGRLEAVEAALVLLSEEQRNCIVRFYLKDQSYREISDETGLSMKEVKSHLQNGKRNLRIIIEKKSDGNGG